MVLDTMSATSSEISASADAAQRLSGVEEPDCLPRVSRIAERQERLRRGETMFRKLEDPRRVCFIKY